MSRLSSTKPAYPRSVTLIRRSEQTSAARHVLERLQIGESMTTHRPKVPSRMRSRESSTHSKVIHAGERFIAARATTTTALNADVITPDFKARYRTPEKSCCTFASSLESLPFVKMKGGGRCVRPASYWKDTPTGNGRDDFKRGQKYAALTIAAIAADDCAAWDLARIIEAMVADAASRKVKGGKYSRTLPPAIDGFIHELTRQLCANLTTTSEP